MQTPELKKRLDAASERYRKLQEVWRANSREAIGTVPCPHEWTNIDTVIGHNIGELVKHAGVKKWQPYRVGYSILGCVACGRYALQDYFGKNRRVISKQAAHKLDSATVAFERTLVWHDADVK